MAYVFTIASPIDVADHGGDPLVVRQADAQPALTFGLFWRLVVVRLTAPGVYEAVAEVPNGKEDEAADVELVGGLRIHRIAPGPQDAASPANLRRLVGYAPRLAPGTYYVRVYEDVSTVWTLRGVSDAFRVLARVHPDEVYRVRECWPSPPYYTGPRTMADAAMIEP